VAGRVSIGELSHHHHHWETAEAWSATAAREVVPDHLPRRQSFPVRGTGCAGTDVNEDSRHPLPADYDSPSRMREIGNHPVVVAVLLPCPYETARMVVVDILAVVDVVDEKDEDG